MLNREFAAWLDGFLSVFQPRALTGKQIYIVRNHANLVRAVEGVLDAPNQAIFDWTSCALAAEQVAFSTDLWSAHAAREYQLTNQTDLAYWLQGALEIGQPEDLSLDQIRHIAHTIDLASNAGALGENVIGLLGLMALYPAKSSLYLRDIKDYLNSLFLHVIDPTYEGDQDLLGRRCLAFVLRHDRPRCSSRGRRS